MNEKIKQLTSDYLLSLNSSGINLDETKLQKIIDINSQSEWIIFNACSLQSQKKTYTDYTGAEALKCDNRGRVLNLSWTAGFDKLEDYLNFHYPSVGSNYTLVPELENAQDASGNFVLNADGTRKKVPTGENFVRDNSNGHYLNAKGNERERSFSPERFAITSNLLKEILKETIKIYEPECIEETDKIEDIVFTGGSGISAGHAGHVFTQPAVYFDITSGEGNKDCWLAVNKKILSENYESVVVASLNNDRRHWKKAFDFRIDELLNSPDITSSREKEKPQNPHQSPEEDQDQPLPPSNSDIQFTIEKIEQDEDKKLGWFWITPHSHFTVNGIQITLISLRKGETLNKHFQNGDLAVGNTIIISGIEFGPTKASIDNWGGLLIDENFSNLRVVSQQTEEEIPHPPHETPIFTEVRERNQELSNQENEMNSLCEELLIKIRENQEICQEAKEIGLELQEILANDVLYYFQEDFFTKLDERFSLDSPINKEINYNNEKIMEKKFLIKENVYRIFNYNNERYLEKKNEEENPAPQSELKTIKQRTKEELNKILMGKDSLTNTELRTLLKNSKYQNWEEEIEKFSTAEEILAYQKAFLKSLEKIGIGDNKKDIINAPSVKAAQNIAKEIIRGIFKKYNINPTKLKGKIWNGNKTWQSYLETLDRKKQINEFVQAVEREVMQMSSKKPPNVNEKTNKDWESYLPLTIISFTFLAIIILAITKVIRNRKK